jgi:hypothetical protein
MNNLASTFLGGDLSGLGCSPKDARACRDLVLPVQPRARLGVQVLNAGRRFMVQPYFPPRKAAARTNSGRTAVEFFANVIRSV